MHRLAFFYSQTGVDTLITRLRRWLGTHHRLVLERVDRVCIQDVVYAVVNHVLELFFLVYHRLDVLGLLVCHVGLVDFFLEATRVICFGTGGEWTKCCIHDIIVVEEVLLLTLIGPAHLVEPTHIFVLHLLHLCKISTLRRLVLEIHIAEVRKIDIHLADGSQKFGSVEGCLGLSEK